MAYNDELSSGFLFYENRYGFNFRCLGDLLEQESMKVLRIKPKNVSEANKVENLVLVEKFEVTQQFNVLDGINNGAYASSMVKLDLLKQKIDVVGYDPLTADVKRLNGYFPFNSASNRFGGNIASFSGYVRFYPVKDDELADKWLLQRASELALLNNQRVLAIIPGDSELTVGDVVGVDFPSYSSPDNPESIATDLLLSGRYLVTNLRHRVARNKHYSFVELCKNSNAFDIVAATETEPYDRARKL
jgi:hypothetical protein